MRRLLIARGPRGPGRRFPRSSFLLVVAACGGGGAASVSDAASAPDAAVVAPDATADSPERLRAATTFRANCATCHGPRGEGGSSWIVDGLAPRIAGKLPSIITWRVREGSPPRMPAFHADEISDEALAELAAYVATLPGGLVPAPVADVEVVIRDRDPWFAPTQVRVERGQVVRFRNLGATYHDVSQLEWITGHGAHGISSGQLGPQGEFVVRFDEPGVFTFACKDHPYMRGQVSVGQPFVAPQHGAWTPRPRPTRAGAGEVWVAAQFQDQPGDTGDGVIHVIEAATWRDAAQIPVGNNPHNLASAGARVLVTSWFDNKVTILDAGRRAVEKELAVGATAAHVLVPPGGGIAWVSIGGSHYLQGIDLSDLSRARRIMVTGNMPHGLAWGGGRLLVASSMTDDASVVDVALEAEVARIPAGHYPMGAAVSPDGAEGYVGNCLDGTVAVLDLVAATKVASVELGDCVVQVAVTDEGRRLVAAHGTRTAIIDVATRRVVADLETGRGAHGIALGPSADGATFAYVTHKFDDHVAVLDVGAAVHLGDVPLVVTTGPARAALAGGTTTGGQGILVRP